MQSPEPTPQAVRDYAEEEYVPVAFDPNRLDRTDDFLETVLPGSLIAFVVGVSLLYILMGRRTSERKR